MKKLNRQFLQQALNIFDQVIFNKLGRQLQGEEKELAHLAIRRGLSYSLSNQLPFSIAYEKLLPRLPGKKQCGTVYLTIRRYRNELEAKFKSLKRKLDNRQRIIRPLLRKKPNTHRLTPALGLHMAIAI